MTEHPTAAAHLRHQLRTPLNHIIGYTEMLLEDAEGTRPGLAADLRGIHAAAHRLLVLVNDYLESPKGAAGAADPAGSTAPFTAGGKSYPAGSYVVKTAQALLNNGASAVYACCSHPVLSGPAIENIVNSALTEVVVTNTIPLTEAAKRVPKIKVLTIAGLIGRAIQSIHEETSVSKLFL